MSSKPPRLPTVTEAGDMLAYMSAATRRRMLDGAFEDLGGRERLVHEAGRTPESYMNFLKLWAKGPLPVTQNKTEHSVNANSVEDLWEKLEARKRENAAGVIHDQTVIDVIPEEE